MATALVKVAEEETTELPRSGDSVRSHYSIQSFKQYAMILGHSTEITGDPSIP